LINMKNIIKNLIFITIVVGLVSIINIGAAQAQSFQTTGSPDDTTAGTVITAEAAEAVINYTDTNSNPKPPVNPASDLEITVLPVYGFTMALLEDQNLYVGQMVTNESSLTNEGNASDALTITFEAAFVNVLGTWTVNIRRSSDDSLIGTLTPGSPSTSETLSPALGEDADWGYYHEVQAPAVGTGTPDAYVIVTTEASTPNTPTGQYTGANGLTYGGQGFTSEATIYRFNTPLMQLTRTSTVDAPNIYRVLPDADAHDAVPGSIITYTLTYSNAGNTSAAEVVIVDKVPSSEGFFRTHAAHFNVTGSTTNVDLTPGHQNATGWYIYYSTSDNPTKDYIGAAGSGWNLVGQINNASTEFFPAAQTYYISDGNTVEAKWVKWEKATVPDTEDDQTLTYGVTIR
jgi:uncharacterized repeat protein (TIGR01451 family)